MSRTIRATLASLTLALALAPAALAQPPVRISVAASGVDLAQPVSGKVLLDLIQASTRKACIAPGHATRQSIAGCMRQATVAAVRKANIPTLTAALNSSDRPTQLASR